jgi:uncharacterized membrane protein YheB (UPF0754 family)
MSEIQESNKKVYDVSIFNSISLVEQEQVVTNIVNGLFENGYSPVRYTYAFWKEIMRAYTDFDINIDEDELSTVIETSNITTVIKEKVRSIQLDNIENAVDELIAARLNRSEFDNLCENANRLLNKYDEILSAFFKSKKGKMILNNLSKKNFTEQDLVNAVINASQKKESDLKS